MCPHVCKYIYIYIYHCIVHHIQYIHISDVGYEAMLYDIVYRWVATMALGAGMIPYVPPKHRLVWATRAMASAI